jgi:hypothetical protein
MSDRMCIAFIVRVPSRQKTWRKIRMVWRVVLDLVAMVRLWISHLILGDDLGPG